MLCAQATGIHFERANKRRTLRYQRVFRAYIDDDYFITNKKEVKADKDRGPGSWQNSPWAISTPFS